MVNQVVGRGGGREWPDQSRQTPTPSYSYGRPTSVVVDGWGDDPGIDSDRIVVDRQTIGACGAKLC